MGVVVVGIVGYLVQLLREIKVMIGASKFASGAFDASDRGLALPASRL